MKFIKPLIIKSLILFSGGVIAQQNTLPNSGNVGIGTATPTEALEVTGNVKIDSCLMVKDSAIFTKSMRLEEHMKIGGNLSVSGESDFNGNVKLLSNLTLNNLYNSTNFASGNNILVLDTAGLVSKLNLKDLILGISEHVNVTPCITNADNTGVPNPMWSSGLNKIFIGCETVNVGIGHSSPQYKLSVAGSTRISGSLGLGTNPHNDVQLNSKTFKQVGLCIEHKYSDDWGYGVKTIVNRDNTKAFGVFNDNLSKDVFRVMGNGTVWATEIYVDNVDDFPDYVFESNYKLLTFEDLRVFISNNKHLPNVPSAKDVEENGMNMGELQRVQMEKIEELTLYILQLEQRLKEVENQLNKD